MSARPPLTPRQRMLGADRRDVREIDVLAPAVSAAEEPDTAWEALRPRQISDADWAQFETWIARIFSAMGMPLDTPSTGATPRRFLRALFDATEGYEGDEKAVTAFPTECHGGPDCRISQVVEGPIPFFALCEHHAFPFFGRVYIGYVAHEHIIGISKLTRLVRVFARRFTVQERLGQQLADALDRVLVPHGVAVCVDAMHLCTQMRGVRELEASTRTTYWRGTYDADAELRAEFYSLAGVTSGRFR